MSNERVKFDDETAAKIKIATAPDVTVSEEDIPKPDKEQVKEQVATSSEQAQSFFGEEDVGWFSRLLVNDVSKLLETVTGNEVDKDRLKAADEICKRVLIRAPSWFCVPALVGIFVAPAIPPLFRWVFKPKNESEDENE